MQHVEEAVVVEQICDYTVIYDSHTNKANAAFMKTGHLVHDLIEKLSKSCLTAVFTSIMGYCEAHWDGW